MIVVRVVIVTLMCLMIRMPGMFAMDLMVRTFPTDVVFGMHVMVMLFVGVTVALFNHVRTPYAKVRY